MSTVILFEGASASGLGGLEERPKTLDESQLLWVDLDAPPKDALAAVVEEFHLDQPTANRLGVEDGGPYFRDTEEYVHVCVSTPTSEAGTELIEVECVVGDRWVVTVHDGEAAVLEEFKERAGGSGATGELDGPGFLATLVEWMLTEHAVAFERVEQELEEFDSRAMRGSEDAEDEIEHLIRLRNRVGWLRRSLTAHRMPLVALAHPELVGLKNEDSSQRFQLVLERFESTLQEARDARESTVSSFEVLIARTGHRTNEIMKILTLASVIFLPGALIAGILGMNFKVGLFEHNAYFWVALAMMVMIGVITLTVARLRRWI